MRVNFKRCLIGLQKGVSKRSKGHLLQAKWALIRSQLTPFYSSVFEFYLQGRITEGNRRRQNDKKTKRQKKKGRRKIIFYIFPFGLYSFLSPLLSTPSLRGRRLEKRLNCFTDQCRLDGCCTSQTFLVCFLHFYFQQ